MNAYRNGLCVAMVCLVAGCSALNPYNETSMCPALNDYGECVSMKQAYDHSLQDDGKEPQPANYDANAVLNTAKGDNKTTSTPKPAPKSPQADYRTQLYREMASILQDPRTPMVKPPKVRRALILTYEDGALYMPRYAYLMLEKTQWMLDETVGDTGESRPVELFMQGK